MTQDDFSECVLQFQDSILIATRFIPQKTLSQYKCTCPLFKITANPLHSQIFMKPTVLHLSQNQAKTPPKRRTIGQSP
jgi:hypothetical protein